MKYINEQLLNNLSNRAKESARKRMIHNFHDSLDERVHRMLNALELGTYVQPHKHETPDKTEAFIILKGKVLVVIFNDNGEIKEFVLLSAKDGNFGIEIPPRVWHSLIAMEEGSVIYEVKDGPYSVTNDKDFAPWAPREGDANCTEYINSVLKRCKLL
jgi:cupin fold WbuC family metalloprotein